MKVLGQHFQLKDSCFLFMHFDMKYDDEQSDSLLIHCCMAVFFAAHPSPAARPSSEARGHVAWHSRLLRCCAAASCGLARSLLLVFAQVISSISSPGSRLCHVRHRNLLQQSLLLHSAAANTFFLAQVLFQVQNFILQSVPCTMSWFRLALC